MPDSVDYCFIYSNVSILHLILLNYSLYLSRVLQMGLCFLPSSVVRLSLLKGFLLGTQGTLLSANMAIKRKTVIHVGGGLHHANFKFGSGLCAYNDIGLASKYLLDFHGARVKRVLVIDLDANQGNGVQRDKLVLGDRLVIADIYNPLVFPKDEYAKQFIDFSRTVTKQNTSAEYIQKLREMVEEVEK